MCSDLFGLGERLEDGEGCVADISVHGVAVIGRFLESGGEFEAEAY
ncbi:MAG: hypothetical protein ACSHYB_06340 [Roseibacillus sp.]